MFTILIMFFHQFARLMRQCETFLVEHGPVPEDEPFFLLTPRQDAPLCIVCSMDHGSVSTG